MPVKDLDKAKNFFTQLGFKLNPKFTDDKARCIQISDDNYIMLLSEPFFKSFTKKGITDSTKQSEVIITISAESQEEVDSIVNKAFELGAIKNLAPQEQPGMYGWGFIDLDGHIWEVVYMDMNEFSNEY